jgi:hypothetical protein
MGNRITLAAPHLSAQAVWERMQKEPRSFRRRRWEIKDLALIAPRKAEDIARTVGVSLATVHQVISTGPACRSSSYRDTWEGRAAARVPHAGTRTRLSPAVPDPCYARRAGDSCPDKARV